MLCAATWQSSRMRPRRAFKSDSEIVIPSGEVSWSDRRWGWRFSTKNSRYGNLTRVSIGLGKVPPQTHVDVVVSNLRLLPESPVVLRDPVISINNGTLFPLGHCRLDIRSNRNCSLACLSRMKVGGIRQLLRIMPPTAMPATQMSASLTVRPRRQILILGPA